MRTTIKIPMKTTDYQAVISTTAEVLEPHRYTRLELQDITIWHKKDKYFAVSFQNNTANLQGWSEAIRMPQVTNLSVPPQHNFIIRYMKERTKYPCILFAVLL